MSTSPRKGRKPPPAPTEVVAKTPAKRPRVADARLSDLMAAAADVFLEQGFDKASLQEISQRAGASKATLYGRYPSKEALFSAVIEHRVQLILEEMAMDNMDGSEPLEASLTRFGTGLLQTVLSDRQVDLIRTISNVSARFPQLGEQFFRLGTLSGLRILTSYLKLKQASGELSDGEPADLMAQQFASLTIDTLLYRKLLGIAGHQTRPDQAAQVGRAVTMFLRCYALPDGPKSQRSAKALSCPVTSAGSPEHKR